MMHINQLGLWWSEFWTEYKIVYMPHVRCVESKVYEIWEAQLQIKSENSILLVHYIYASNIRGLNFYDKREIFRYGLIINTVEIISFLKFQQNSKGNCKLCIF